MGKAERIGGAFWFLFSVFIVYHSYRLGLGTLHMPGPGFITFWTAIFIGVLSLIDMGRSLRSPGGEGVPRSSNLPKVVFVLISLFLYVVLVERLGFIPVTLFLFLFLLGVIEKKTWPFAVAASVLVTAFSYLIFEVALQSQLPKGLLEFLRF